MDFLGRRIEGITPQTQVIAKDISECELGGRKNMFISYFVVSCIWYDRFQMHVT